MPQRILDLYEQKKSEIRERLNEFKNLNGEEYFYELLFCLLTPQSNAQKCWHAVEILKNVKNFNEEVIKKILRKHTRFHNRKTSYILEAEKNWQEIKSKLSNSNIIELRSRLAENVHGLGLKEASHFLRNIGKSNNQIAILDRHILKNMHQIGLINEQKIKNKKDYFKIEKKFLNYANEINIPPDELDLFWWSKENGEIFK